MNRIMCNDADANNQVESESLQLSPRCKTQKLWMSEDFQHDLEK